jgi:hypothetical protein
MTQIIRSGAFLQQCWSVHPLCVTVKRITNDRTLVLVCSSCRFAHHLALGCVVPKASQVEETAGASPGTPVSEGEALLGRCVGSHQAAITLREMDVFRDSVLLRCAECRRHYEVTVSAFETHQR